VQQFALNCSVEHALEWISSKTNHEWRVRAPERLRRPFDELCKVIKKCCLDLIFGGYRLRCGNRAIDDDRTHRPRRSQTQAPLHGSIRPNYHSPEYILLGPINREAMWACLPIFCCSSSGANS